VYIKSPFTHKLTTTFFYQEIKQPNLPHSYYYLFICTECEAKSGNLREKSQQQTTISNGSPVWNVTFVQQRIYHVLKEWDKGKNQKWVDGLQEHNKHSDYELSSIYMQLTQSLEEHSNTCTIWRKGSTLLPE